MKSKPIRHDRFDQDKVALDKLIGKLYRQTKAQFGDAIQSFWFYDDDLCPACAERPIGTVKYKGQEALSLNAFIYRERGVLIGYFLCETCAKHIFRAAQKNPYTQMPLHANIEKNLIAAYHNTWKSLMPDCQNVESDLIAPTSAVARQKICQPNQTA